VEQEGIKNIQSEKNKQKDVDLNQAKNLTAQLLNPSVSKKSLEFFKNPLDAIKQKLDYHERNRLQNSDIKKDPIDRAKEFISSFEETSVSEIRNLK